MKKINKSGKLFLAFLTILLVVSSGYQLARRVSWDKANNNYAAAFRYGEIVRESSLAGKEPMDLIERLDPTGTSLVLFRIDLATGVASFSPKLVEQLKAAGIDRGVEIQNLHLADQQISRDLLDQLNGIEPNLLLLKGSDTANPPAEIINWLQNSQPILGTIEFREVETTRSLAKAQGLPAVRVHRVFEEEIGTLTETESVARYVRAVRERNIGVIEYRLKPNRLPQDHRNSLEAIEGRLSELGFRLGSLEEAKGTGEPIASSRLLILLLLAAAATLLFASLAPSERLSPKSTVGTFGLAATIAAVGLYLFPVLTRQAGALLIALIGPLGGYRLVTKYGRSFQAKFFGSAFLDFAGLTVFSAFLGVVLSGILLDESFLLKLHQFRGVKLALFLPIPVLLAAYLISERIKVSQLRFDYKKAIAGLALLGLFGLILLRSGNFTFLEATELEEAVRRWLDEAFLVRPRFKEFLLGHPFLIVWLYLAGLYRNKFPLYKLGFFLVGFVGQISVINTFAHVHTPITLSLIRTANGLVGGLLVGSVLVGAMAGGVRIWRLLKG